MKVKDAIIKACDFVGKDELALSLKNSQTLTQQQDELCNRLVSYFNLIRQEIAQCYQPNLQAEIFAVKNFKLEFSKFSKPLQEIYSIKDKFGRNVNYKVFDGYVFVCAKEVEVIYSSDVEPLALESEFFSQLPERVFAYGIAREYFFVENLYEDANVWEGRFKGALEIMTRRKSEIRIPQRRWI